MTEDGFIELAESALIDGGATIEEGEEVADPPLEVLRYARRTVRVSWVPWLGKAQSVTAIVRQPGDLGSSAGDQGKLLARLARAVNTRFPPWNGPVVCLTVVALTPDPIGPDDEGIVRKVLDDGARTLKRMRVVPFGLIRVDLGRRTTAFSLNAGPNQMITEPHRLADLCSEHLGRFVSLIGET